MAIPAEAAIARDLEQMKLAGHGGALFADANGSEQQKNRMAPAGLGAGEVAGGAAGEDGVFGTSKKIIGRR